MRREFSLEAASSATKSAERLAVCMVLNCLQLQCELWVIEAFLFASEPRFEVVQTTHHNLQNLPKLLAASVAAS